MSFEPHRRRQDKQCKAVAASDQVSLGHVQTKPAMMLPAEMHICWNLFLPTVLLRHPEHALSAVSVHANPMQM